MLVERKWGEFEKVQIYPEVLQDVRVHLEILAPGTAVRNSSGEGIIDPPRLIKFDRNSLLRFRFECREAPAEEEHAFN